MLIPVYLRQFEKEVIKTKKRGKPIEKLKKIMTTLSQEKPIPLKHRNHKLKGEYIGKRQNRPSSRLVLDLLK